MQEKQKTKTISAQPKLTEINPATVQQIRMNQTIKCLRKLMSSMRISPEQAMTLLQIPKADRKSYRAILTNNKEQKK